jgi:hypothetical protein
MMHSGNAHARALELRANLLLQPCVRLGGGASRRSFKIRGSIALRYSFRVSSY